MTGKSAWHQRACMRNTHLALKVLIALKTFIKLLMCWQHLHCQKSEKVWILVQSWSSLFSFVGLVILLMEKTLRSREFEADSLHESSIAVASDINVDG